MATTIATRTYRASGWSSSEYILFTWTATTSNRTSSSVKVSVTSSVKAYGVTKAQLIEIGGTTTPYCTVNSIAFSFDSFQVANLGTTQTSTKTQTISSIGSSATTLSTATSTLSGSSISLSSSAGTSISVAKYTPPKSTPSWSGNITMGVASTINTNRSSSSYTHTMSYKIGDLEVWSASGVGASVSFNAPDTSIISISDLCATIPSSNYVSGTLTTKTYNGSTLIGTTTQTLNLYVPSYSVDFTSSIEADNSLLSVPTCTEYISNYSKIKASVSSFTTSYSATLQKYVLTNGSNSSERSTDGNLSVLATDTSVQVRGIDSRGIYKDYDSTITLKTYVPPTLTTYNFTRGTNQLTLTYQGNMTELLNGNTAVNDVTIKVIYESTEMASFSATHTSGVISGTQTITWSNLPASTLNVEVVITDTFGSSATYQVTIPTLEIPLDLHWSKKGVAIGKVSESDGTNGLLEINWTTLLKGNKLGFEQDTTDTDWYFGKFDGLTIAFAQKTLSHGSTTARGNLYSADFTATIPSGIFTATPMIFGSLGKRTVTLVGVQTGGASATSILGRVMRTTSSSGTDFIVNLLAVGV